MTTAPTTMVPASREALLDPAWLLAHLDDLREGDEILRVEPTETSKTRAEKLRFAVTVRTPDGLRVRFYCAKAHLDGSPSSGIISEARFYRDLAPRLDVRRPRVPYVAIDAGGDSAIIVMEDIVAAGGLFMNPHRPLSVDTTRDTLTQLARLHASTWDLTSVRDIEWLGPGRASIGGMYSAAMLQTLLDDGRADGLPAELRSGENLVAALDAHAQHPVTCVLHGDTHTGNVYLDADGRGCFFDWEVVQVGNWAQDVAYHLGSVLRVDDRRAHERELVRHYLTELAAGGAPAPGFDEGYDLYERSFSYGYLLWVITQIRGRDEVLAHMPRLAAAMSDHDVYRRLGIL